MKPRTLFGLRGRGRRKGVLSARSPRGDGDTGFIMYILVVSVFISVGLMALDWVKSVKDERVRRSMPQSVNRAQGY